MEKIYLKRRVLWVVLLWFLFSSSTAFASSLSQATVIYSKGMTYFSKGEYRKALQFFRQAYRINPNEKENVHLLGLTYMKLNRFDLGEKYLKELLDKNPDYTQAYFDYGVCLYRQGEARSALPWFEKTQKLFPDTFAGKTAKKLALKIKGEKETKEKQPLPKKRWSLKGATGLFYDSNVTQDPDNESLAGFPNQKDYAMTVSGNFRYLLLSGEKTNLFADVSSYQSAYLSIYLDSNNFNFGRHQGGFEFTYRLNDYIQWRLPFNYTFETLGNSKYVQTERGESIFDILWMNNWLTTITGGMKKDDFFGSLTNTSQNRDATEPYARIEQYFFAPHNREFYIKGGFEFEKNFAAGNDWDYNAYHVLAALQTPLFSKIKLLLLEDVVARRSFITLDSIFNAQRSDQSAATTAVLSKEIVSHLSLLTSYTFFISDSNIPHFTHKRHVAGLTLQIKL